MTLKEQGQGLKSPSYLVSYFFPPERSGAILRLQFVKFWAKVHLLPLYLSNLHSLTWKMFQISGKAPTYVKTYLYSSSVCKWDGKASRSFSFKHLCHLCMEKWWAIGLSRYHSGNWVTSHTMCYINITGGDSYKEKYKRRAAFRAALAIFRHAQCIFSKKQLKKK